VGDVIGLANTDGSTTYWRLNLTSVNTHNCLGCLLRSTMRGRWSARPRTISAGFSSAIQAPHRRSFPPLAGDDQSVVQDINDEGIIVGWSRIAGTDPTTAVAWRAVVNERGTSPSWDQSPCHLSPAMRVPSGPRQQST